MNWFLLSLTTALLIGIGQICIKKGLSHISSLWTVVFDAIFTLLLVVPFTLHMGVRLDISPMYLLLFLLIAALYTLFYYAIEREQISLSGTVFATYPIVTIFLSQVFLHERINVIQGGLIVLIVCGVILLSYQEGGLSQLRQVKKHIWLLWAILGAFTTGVGDFLAKVALSTTDVNSYLFYFSLAFAVSTCLFWILDKKGRKLPTRISFPKLRYTFLGTCMISLSVISLSYALSIGKASLVSPVTSAYVPLTAILAFLILNENLSRLQVVGIVFVSIGVIAIGA